MQTNYRDNAIAKNRLLFKLTLLWALSSTLGVIVLAITCFYAITHRQVHWLPICTGLEFSIGDSAYSPAYLKQMTEKVADLRLTYNPETIDARYTTLIHLIPNKNQTAFKKVLDQEIDTVHKKNISSVFYSDRMAVDVQHQQGQIAGLLYRTSHGIPLKPKHKTYQLQFVFKNGLLELQSLKEIDDAQHH